MNFPRYPRYRDSGVEWLGEVPAHWEVERLGAMFREVCDEGAFDLPILSVSIHDGVSDSELNESELDRKVTRSEDRSKYKRVQPGDLVYNMMRAWQGAFGAVSVEGLVSPAYVVARPCASLSSSLAERILRTPRAIEEMRRHSKGVADFRLRLYWEEFKTIRVPVAPRCEQLAIDGFLNCETAKVDALIAEQQRLVELLKEKRQAAISHAVTKGLNRDAPLRASGIQWLGDVPAHWHIVPLKHLASVRTGVAKGKDHSNRLTVTVPYLRVANVQDGFLDLANVSVIDIPVEDLERYALRSGDVLMNEGGDFDKLGRGHVWRGEIEPCVTQNHVFAVRPRDVSSEWLNAVTGSSYARGYFISRSKQSTNLASISSTNLMELPVVLPPTDEQAAILRHVEAQSLKLNTLTSEAERSIALLEERRVALITNAITGKIDVRRLTTSQAEAA